MLTFVVLGKFTQEGITKIKESPQRLGAARKVVKSTGGELKEFYYTMGRYDFVAIVEGPSNEAAMQSLFAICSVGAVRTETLVAVPAEKAAAEIIKKLP
jgi:uncharacterized protein with GYD domain